jgi:DNA-binding MarR family transcriptional regulator
MEEAGLVVRKPDAADARLVRLHLTASGSAARDPVRAARAALERHATATLTASEQEVLRCALTKIIAQLQD